MRLGAPALCYTPEGLLANYSHIPVIYARKISPWWLEKNLLEWAGRSTLGNTAPSWNTLSWMCICVGPRHSQFSSGNPVTSSFPHLPTMACFECHLLYRVTFMLKVHKESGLQALCHCWAATTAGHSLSLNVSLR